MSVMNGRLETPQGAPKSLVFDMPSSMLNANKFENRIQPAGQSNFSSAGQTVKFIIPQTDRAFFNPQTCYITGQCELAGTFGAVSTDLNYVLGTYWSMFSRYTVSSNGKTLETIERPSELINAVLNMTLNPGEKRGMANSLGYYNDPNPTYDGDVTLNICQAINTGPATNVLPLNNGRTWTFALPLIGLLNCSKQLPLAYGDFTIELLINALPNWLAGGTAAAIAAIPNITFNLKDLELVFDQLTLTPESNAMVMSPYPEKIHIKSESYMFGAGTPFASAAGTIDIPVSSKVSSLKQVILYFNQTDLVDKTYGGINPNMADIVFQTNGAQHPQRPLKGNNPSEMYMQIQKSYGSVYSNNHSGSAGKLEFCRRNTTDGTNLYYPALLNTTPANIILASNKFYISIDTELINYDAESLYSGIAMGVNSSFRLNIANQTSTSYITPYFWLNYDAVIEIDIINGITSVIN